MRLKTKVMLQRVILVFILIGSILLFTWAFYKIWGWNQDNQKIKKQTSDIAKIIKKEEVKTDDEKTLINPPSTKEDDYWDYIKLPFASVDFTDLLNKNADTVAFLEVMGTNINYPVVQTNNNSYYLTHAYDKSKNEAGWVFLDYRNDIDKLDQNTIIYAHGRWDTTMFGSLKNILKNNWYENTENYVVKLSTPQYNSLWQVFSVYQIPTETYYLTSNFGSSSEYLKFLNQLEKRSAYKFRASLTTEDKILTLSTCLNDKVKVVLHAKLIKRQAR